MKNFSNLLVYLFIFLLPLQTRLIYDSQQINGSFWEYGSKFIYATQILLLAILIFSFIKLTNSKQIKFNSFSLKKLWPLSIPILLLLSSLFSLNLQFSFYKLSIFFSLAAFVLILIIQKIDIKQIYTAFTLSALVQGLLAISQFLTQKIYASKWLGIAAQDPNILGTSVVETNGERILRAYGSLSHPNILGGFLAISLLIIISLYFTETNKRKKIALATIYIINNLALLMTGSRSAILGLLVGLFVYYLFNKKETLAKIKPTLNFFLMITVIIFAFFALRFPQITQTRLFGDERLEALSTQERLDGYQQAWQVYKSHWALGVGPGNYSLALSEKYPGQPAYAYQPVHNTYLLFLVETGIFGLLIYLIIFIALIYWIKKNYRKLISDISQHSALTCLLTLLTIGLFDHWLYSFYFGNLLLALIIALLIKQLQANS